MRVVSQRGFRCSYHWHGPWYPSFVTEKQKQEYRANHQMWLKFHNEWLEKVPHGQHIITENSGHGIPSEEPELVVSAIRQEFEKAQRNRAKP